MGYTFIAVAIIYSVHNSCNSYMGFAQTAPYDEKIKELVAGSAPVGGIDVSEFVNSIYDDLLEDHIDEVQQEVVCVNSCTLSLNLGYKYCF